MTEAEFVPQVPAGYIHGMYQNPSSRKLDPARGIFYYILHFILYMARCDTQKNSPSSQINVEPKKASTKILFHPLPFFFVVFFSSATSQWSTSKPMKSPKPALAKHLRFLPLFLHWMALGPTTRWAWVPGETRKQQQQQHHHSSIETDKKTTSKKKIKVSVFFALEKLKN